MNKRKNNFIKHLLLFKEIHSYLNKINKEQILEKKVEQKRSPFLLFKYFDV